MLSQKNRSVQEVEAAMLACRSKSREKYQRSAKEIIEELRRICRSHAGAGNDRKRIRNTGASIPTRSRENQTALSKQTQMNTSLKKKRRRKRKWKNNDGVSKVILEEQRGQYIHLSRKSRPTKTLWWRTKRNVSVNESGRSRYERSSASARHLKRKLSGLSRRSLDFEKQTTDQRHRWRSSGVDVPQRSRAYRGDRDRVEPPHSGCRRWKWTDARQPSRIWRKIVSGRATFTADDYQSPSFARLCPVNRQAVSGFIGVASELVQSPEHVQTITDNLLGSIWLPKTCKVLMRIPSIEL